MFKVKKNLGSTPPPTEHGVGAAGPNVNQRFSYTRRMHLVPGKY